MTWHRHARWAAGACALGAVALVWMRLGERQLAPPSQPVAALEPNAVSEITGGDVVQLKGATRDVRVEFATQVLYSDGSAKYTRFKAHIDNRGGRSFTVSGADARVTPNQQAFDVSGDVELTTSDGLSAKTGRATFTEGDGVLRGDGPIVFSRARVSGSGVGFAYHRETDRLELIDQTRIVVADEAGAGGMTIAAGSAAYSRVERFMRFERTMRLERPGQIMAADTATVFLLADRDETESVELRGGSSITGDLMKSAMEAHDITLDYAADGRTLERAWLVGDSTIQLVQPDGSPGQRLSAPTQELSFAGDGTISRLLARDAVRAAVPAVGDRPAREITSQMLTADGKGGRGLSQMVFESNVVYREDVPGATPRVVRSRLLNASLAESGAVDRALFSGGFDFNDGQLTAKSAEAVYDTTQGTLELRGPDSTPPHVKNGRLDLRAATIDATLAPLRVTAMGRVSALFLAGKGGTNTPSVLDATEDVQVLCERLVFDEKTGKGEYSGGAVLLQGRSGTQIRGETITIDEQAGSLHAKGSVLTVLPIARSDDTEKGNSIGRAAEFAFDDQLRRVVYATSARLDGGQGQVWADRIELALATEGHDVRQMTARGTVKVMVDGREATGQQLVYHPADTRYVLSGAPVRLTEDCQELVGRTLIFQRGSNTITVDGNQQIRGQVKGGKCPQ